ncbi:hypothetical protein D4A92_21475 [Rhizobium rosettiformans]|uniref:AAA+ ATPase domain-containing protein n=1 Tax=Rhizobium rosettiformans TaxID=1368430 RepID=A0ABX7F287_9HYPH|nr:AAA family ATPase [Rhizobium rosettiformans]QRF53836.1 hypothetical protein D4A92_21475 [Rhizobium rosettiformans]
MDRDQNSTPPPEQQQGDPTRVYVPTPTSQHILATLEFAKEDGEIVSISGMPGIGKTQSLKQLQQTSRNVWYCEFSDDTSSVFATLTEIAVALGINEVPSKPDDVRRQIVRRVQGSQGIILCDEAQHLNHKGFEVIRTIHDRSGVAIAFCGHLDLADKIARLPQLSGRITAPLRIGAARAEDADALFDAWGLTDKRSREYLRRYAANATGLRRIAKAFRQARRMALGAQKPISFEHIRAAWASLQETVIEA